MKQSIILLTTLILPITLLAEGTTTVAEELKALEGKWKAVAMEAAGIPLPKANIPSFFFNVSSGGKAIGISPSGESQSTINVDPTKNPKTINNRHDSGPTKGKTQYGIYQLEGDKWTVCMTPPGAKESDRPKDFKTANTTSATFIFERQNKDQGQ